MIKLVDELKVPIISIAICSFVSGGISWLVGSPIWVGAVLGGLAPIIFFAGAILAVIGMIEIVADYLKEKSR